MNLNDSARVRSPRGGFENRLGTVTDIQPAAYACEVDQYRFRLPTGEERTYPAADITACTRADDHAALWTRWPGGPPRCGMTPSCGACVEGTSGEREPEHGMTWSTT